MQSVLSIDATSNPAIAIVAEVEGQNVRILERKEIKIETSENWEALLASETLPIESQSQTGTDAIARTLELSARFTNALIIIPPLEYHSLLLSLPFKNSKQLNRIVESEIQDIVPFDTADFLLQHHTVGEKTESGYKVHVGAIPKRVIRNSLSLWKTRGVDPLVISTPASILQAVIPLASAEITPTLYCYVAERFCYLAFASLGSVEIDRAIDRSAPYTNGSHGGSVSDKSLLLRIKLELASAERKLGVTFSEAVFLGAPIDCDLAQTLLNIPARVFSGPQTGELASEREQLAVLGALLADDSRAATVLTNFRVGEFAYRPPLKELLGALRILTPYILLTIVLLGLFLLVDYLVEGHEITARENAIAAQIRSVAPDLSYTPGQEMHTLSDEINKVEDELKDLGSPELYSPLETLAALSDAFPIITDVGVDKVDIQGNKISLEGCAPDYHAIETLENTLSRKPAFANVKKQSLSTCTTGRPNGRGFKFDILLKE